LEALENLDINLLQGNTMKEAAYRDWLQQQHSIRRTQSRLRFTNAGRRTCSISFAFSCRKSSRFFANTCSSQRFPNHTNAPYARSVAVPPRPSICKILFSPCTLGYCAGAIGHCTTILGSPASSYPTVNGEAHDSSCKLIHHRQNPVRSQYCGLASK